MVRVLTSWIRKEQVWDWLFQIAKDSQNLIFHANELFKRPMYPRMLHTHKNVCFCFSCCFIGIIQELPRRDVSLWNSCVMVNETFKPLHPQAIRMCSWTQHTESVCLYVIVGHMWMISYESSTFPLGDLEKLIFGISNMVLVPIFVVV